MYSIFDKHWLPKFLQTIHTKWKVTETTEFPSQVGKWAYLMPEKFQSKITNTIIIPRIEEELASHTPEKGFDWIL